MEKSGVVCRSKTWDEKGELPCKSFHLSVRHLEEEMDAGHLLHEQIRVLEWVTSFPEFILVNLFS